MIVTSGVPLSCLPILKPTGLGEDVSCGQLNSSVVPRTPGLVLTVVLLAC